MFVLLTINSCSPLTAVSQHKLLLGPSEPSSQVNLGYKRKMKTNKTLEQRIKQTHAEDGLTNTNYPRKIGPHLHKLQRPRDDLFIGSSSCP